MSKTMRALLILERLASGRTPPTHAELMRELGVQRSTLTDSLSELRDLGYVSVHERRYLPGARLLTFVRRAAANSDLSAGIRPTLEALTASTGETAVYVMEEHGRGAAADTVVAMDQVESPHPIRYVGLIGDPFPIHTTAAGHVFLAFGDREPAAVVPVALSAAEGRALTATLATVRAQGFALVGDATRSTAIAAPVRDVHGAVIGVISVVGPSDRMVDAEASVWPLLRDAATQLSHPALADVPLRRTPAVG